MWWHMTQVWWPPNNHIALSLLWCLCSASPRMTPCPSQWALRWKVDGLLNGGMGWWWMGPGVWLAPQDGAGRPTWLLHSQGFSCGWQSLVQLFIVGCWCLVQCPWPQQALLTWQYHLQSGFLQDLRGLVPPKWTGWLLRWPTGLVIVLICAVLWHCAMFALALQWHPSWPRTTLSFTQGTNASGLVVLAVSALPAGLTPVVPSARAVAAPVTGNAPPCLYMSMHKGLTFPMSTFSAMHAGPRLSRSLGQPWSPRRKGELPNAGTPPGFSRTSIYKSGIFQSLGQQSSVTCQLEVVPSLHDGFLHTRVSSGNRTGDKVKIRNFEGQMGQHAACPPHMVSGCFAPPQAVMLTQCRYLDQWWWCPGWAMDQGISEHLHQA